MSLQLLCYKESTKKYLWCVSHYAYEHNIKGLGLYNTVSSCLYCILVCQLTLSVLSRGYPNNGKEICQREHLLNKSAIRGLCQ